MTKLFVCENDSTICSLLIPILKAKVDMCGVIGNSILHIFCPCCSENSLFPRGVLYAILSDVQLCFENVFLNIKKVAYKTIAKLFFI